MSLKKLIVALMAAFTFLVSTGAAQDANTLLLLRFENSLNGEQGEVPTQSSGHSFQSGIQGQGVLLPNPNQLRYASPGNINSTEGTIEFWVKPTWNGNDGLTHYLVRWGDGGGMVVSKDGANNFRLIVNLFGTAPGGEQGVSFNTSGWTANQWHYVAFTYSNTAKRLRAYVDGVQTAERSFQMELSLVSTSSFQVGGNGAGEYLSGILDEFRISNIERTPQEIADRYFSPLTVSSLTATPQSLQMFPTWWKTPVLQAVTNIGTVAVPPVAVSWISSNPAVANFDYQRGKIVAFGQGSAVLTGTLNAATTNITVNVSAPMLQPVIEQISPNLSNPNQDALWEMPVVIINYLPTNDGVNVDTQRTQWTQSLTALRNRINRENIQFKYMSEESSRFRAYNGGEALPSLAYRAVFAVTVFEPMPEGIPTGNPGEYFPDYEQILTRFNAEGFVNEQNVKEFWIWGYHSGGIAPVESNMSSPTTGDISNSFRHNDLPIFDNTYVVYNLNFTRNINLHTRGHQLESILSHVDRLRTGNTNLFWNLFSGRNANGTFQQGRTGNCHFPPNGVSDYDYFNLNFVNSDIRAWTPAGVVQSQVNASTWNGIFYPLPGNEPQPSFDSVVDADYRWYIYWFQSMPGRGNQIPFQTLASGNSFDETINQEKWEINHNCGARELVNKSFVSDLTGAPSALIQSRTKGRDPVSTIVEKTLAIPQIDNRMTNWWQFTADWDAAVRSGVGLYESSSCSFVPSAQSLNFNAGGGTGSIVLTSGTGCKWFSTSNAPWVTINSGILGNGNGTVNLTVAPNSSGTNRTTKIIIAGKVVSITQSRRPKTAYDFDGDGKSDLSIFRPNALAEWWYQRSSDGGNGAVQFGNSTDLPVPADYTGDGKTDVSFFRPSTGEWFALRSEDSSYYSFPFGTSGDIPLPGDFDADGRSDVAVFRPSSATWYISKSSGGTAIVQFGLTGDKPVVGDFDGDGLADIAIYRTTGSEWWYVKSSTGQAVGLQFGSQGDKAVPADYSGDGKTDVAVWRPSNGSWYVLRSEDSSYFSVPFGTIGDVPAPADYDGDGKSDIAVFRSGIWYLLQTTNGVSIQSFGLNGDTPVPSAFVR